MQVKSLGELHWRDSDDGAYYLKYKHGVVGDANSPRAQPVHAAGLEASATILAESSRQAIILCRVYGTKDSISHAWKLKVHTEACSGTRAERSIELSPLVSPIGDENAMRQFEGHMEIVKLILGSDRSNSEDEELVTLRFSIDSDQVAWICA